MRKSLILDSRAIYHERTLNMRKLGRLSAARKKVINLDNTLIRPKSLPGRPLFSRVLWLLSELGPASRTCLCSQMEAPHPRPLLKCLLSASLLYLLLLHHLLVQDPSAELTFPLTEGALRSLPRAESPSLFTAPPSESTWNGRRNKCYRRHAEVMCLLRLSCSAICKEPDSTSR